MPGLAGLWFLQSAGNGYNILPLHKATHRPEELLLQISDTPAAPSSLDETLLAFHVRWILSLSEPAGTFEDERFFAPFGPWSPPHPSLKQIMNAVEPLLASPSSWQHTVALVIGLRAGSADAMTEVLNELDNLRANPRFPEIVAAIGEYGGPGDPEWVSSLARLISLHTDIPGLDTAAAGALYRVGTKETLPLAASLLDSKDPGAQMIAARTIALRVPPQLSTILTPEFTTPTPGSHATASHYVEFWKTWWVQNRAVLGFPPVQ